MPGPLDQEADKPAAGLGGVPGPDSDAAINQRIFETSLDLILVVDRQGTFIRVSPSALEILGYGPDELVGINAGRLVYPDDLDRTRDEMRLGRRTRATRNFECRYIHKDGRIVTLWWTGVWSPAEAQHFFIGRDITDRKEIERREREDAARLALAVEISEIGLASAASPSEPARTDAQFNRIYGQPPGSPEIGAGEFLRLIHPDDRDGVAAGLLEVIRHGGLYRGEFRIRRGDTGEDRWVRVAMQMVSDTNGLPGRFVGVHLDITDLKETARLLEAAMDVARLGSWAADITADEHPNPFLGWSPETYRICGLEPGAANSRLGTFWELIHPEDRQMAASARQAAIARGGPCDIETRIVRPDGAVRWVRLRAAIIRDAAGAPTRMAGAIQDVTELRSTQQQLQQAQKMEAIGQLTGGMAHDFNNLLGIIIGNLDLLRDNARLDGDNQELLSEAVDAATRGADLIRRLLAFSRRQPLQPQRIALNEMVSGIVGLLGRTLGENIPISLNLAENVWPVRVDPPQLEASLVNLATNARDAMPGGGRLMIATGNRHLDADYAATHAELTPGDYAMIEVSDTGAGIPSAAMGRIFEPFFTTKEVGKGTGLGLSMVFGFVKQSGGHVNVYSEPGTGTTFRLYLPRDRQDTLAADPQTAPGSDAGGGETVLIVEDNAGMRRIVRRQLVELGYRVIEADSAAVALECLVREPVALLFSDIVMPGEMNGIALAQQAIARWPALKVILTSGFPDIRLAGNGDAVAGIRLLSKPYRRADLAEAVREALGPGAA